MLQCTTTQKIIDIHVAMETSNLSFCCLIFIIILISEVKSKKGDDSSVTNSIVTSDTKGSASTSGTSTSRKGDSGIANVMLAAIMHAGFKTGYEVSCIATVNCVYIEYLEVRLVTVYSGSLSAAGVTV